MASKNIFSGKIEEWHIWQTKFKAYVHKKKVAELIEEVEANISDPSKFSKLKDQLNVVLYNFLIMSLDDDNINLISNACPNDGQTAWCRLYQKYNRAYAQDLVNDLITAVMN